MGAASFHRRWLSVSIVCRWSPLANAVRSAIEVGGINDPKLGLNHDLVAALTAEVVKGNDWTAKAAITPQTELSSDKHLMPIEKQADNIPFMEAVWDYLTVGAKFKQMQQVARQTPDAKALQIDPMNFKGPSFQIKPAWRLILHTVRRMNTDEIVDEMTESIKKLKDRVEKLRPDFMK